MELENSERDGVSHVSLVGKMDVTGLHSVDVAFHAATAAQDRPAIVDLTRLEYIASLGMGMIIGCARSLQRKGHRLVLLAPPGPVHTALTTAGIDQAIPLAETFDDALALAVAS